MPEKYFHIGDSIYTLTTPIGRFSYIKEVGKIPLIAKTGEEAYEMRTAIKAYYRGEWLNALLIVRDETYASLLLKKVPKKF